MNPSFSFRILVTAPTPEEESVIVKKIASEFIRLGVPAVSVVADAEYVNYVNGEVYNLTESMRGIAPPEKDPIAAHIQACTKPTLN